MKCGWINELYINHKIFWGKLCLSLCKISITLAIFIDVLVICALHVTFWSIVIPRKLNSVTCSIGLSFIVSLSLGMVLGCLKNTINLVLAVYNKSLLLCNQWDILEISQLISSSITAILFKAPKFSKVDTWVVSSAYIMILNLEVALVMSLINILNSNGPKREPWGIPQTTTWVR